MKVLRLEALPLEVERRLLARPRPWDEDTLRRRVFEIVQAVRTGGDEALRTLTRRYDGIAPETLRVEPEAIAAALAEVPPRVLRALETARAQIERFHRPQRLQGYQLEPDEGLVLGQLIRPYRRVGIYVPKNLPSSLLMAAVPARLAGVQELVVCTPPQPEVPVTVRAACALLGISELYGVGGAQAIAALAYGTESIRPVEKIVGPGSAPVTAAKALVRDHVGIDLLAGPSEVALLVEPVSQLPEATLARWAAAEMRAQLEHGPGTSALLLARSASLAQAVANDLDRAGASDRASHVAVLCYEHLDRALEFVNAYAPEHLGLWGEAAEALVPKVQNAGSLFLGPWAPVAVGDYASGTNHVLPTARGARSMSGLSVHDFLKKISFQRVSPAALRKLAPTVTCLAELEGMKAHAESIKIRWESTR